MSFDPQAATAAYIDALGADALATALVKAAEYRNPRPNVVQEFVFYTHPSVERRVRAAMEWKAAHATAEASMLEAGHGS
jgi:STE24 endopeptidase